MPNAATFCLSPLEAAALTFFTRSFDYSGTRPLDASCTPGENSLALQVSFEDPLLAELTPPRALRGLDGRGFRSRKPQSQAFVGKGPVRAV